MYFCLLKDLSIEDYQGAPSNDVNHYVKSREEGCKVCVEGRKEETQEGRGYGYVEIWCISLRKRSRRRGGVRAEEEGGGRTTSIGLMSFSRSSSLL